MNYLTEIMAFMDHLLTHELSPGQIALWHALMYVCNKTGWKREFTVALSVLRTYTGLSERAVIKNREVLKEMGLIDFTPSSNEAASYSLNSLTGFGLEEDATEESEHNAEQSAGQSTEQSAGQSTALSKQNKTKQNKTKPTGERVAFAEHVHMTQEEMDRLTEEFGQEGAGGMVEMLNAYKGASGKCYRSDYMAIRSWVIKRWREEQASGRTAPQRTPAQYDTQKDFFFGWEEP